MRRLAALLLTLIAAGAAASIALAAGGAGSGIARFDVIFDDARGLIGGQLVKVAGAKAGTIDNVVVTPGFKARIEASIDSRFMPFHEDATCTIRPEGLIAENYVDCDPGTANSPPLKAASGQPPTVPVTNTTEPVSLLDLFNIFNLPTQQRLQVLIDELGIGTSARGQDFNDILRRANPALALARQAISILQHQNTQLASIIDSTNTITTEGAAHTATLQSFLDQAAALTTLTAAHRDSISLAVNRLPGLLAVAQPALQQLDTVAVAATPLVAQIHAAVPSLNKVAADLGPFAATAKPALAKLTGALKRAIPAIRDTTPLVSTLHSYASRSLTGTRLFARLASNLQQHGFVENFLGITYYIGAALSRFDVTSHMLPLLLVGAQNGACNSYATAPVAGCSAHYGQQPAFTPSRQAANRASNGAAFGSASALGAGGGKRSGAAGGSSQASTPPRTSAQGSAPAASTATGPGGTSSPTAPPTLQGATQQTVQTLQNLVNYLLK